MAQFTVPHNRDAYAAILGFRYQVDWTIIRWCELDEKEHLELECGEDIDTVAAALNANDESAIRTLEQIKHLSRRLTLRTPEVRTAIANFAAHQKANPELLLRYRFCSNAHIGVERPCPFSGNEAGIEVWKRIQSVSGLTECQEELTAIKSLLQEGACPAKCNAATWSDFQHLLLKTEDEALLEFIHLFEWAIQQPELETLIERTRLALLAANLCETPEEAEHLHARLFLRVMHKLSRPGRKVLDASQLKEEAKLPALRDADKQALAFLIEQVFSVEIRLEEFEHRLLSQEAGLSEAKHKIEQLTSEVSSNASITLGSVLISTTPPQIVEDGISRDGVTEDIVATYNNKSWVLLRGACGSGKTQLALLVTLKMGSPVVWLSLRDLDEKESTQQLHHLISYLSKRHHVESLDEAADLAVHSLPKPAVIVLEDIPRITWGSAFESIVVAIVGACLKYGVKLLTTSHHEWDSNGVISKDLYSSLLAPLFDKEELHELLQLHSAPESMLCDSTVTQLQSVVMGHPMLSVATIKYLKEKSWSVDVGSLSALDTSEHASVVIDRALHRILQSVKDQEARALLYRLSLVIGVFREPTMLAAAAADPAIPRPRERFSAVEGLWVESLSSQSYSVTPVIRPLAETELEQSTRVSVYSSLASELVSRDHLSVIDVGIASRYFLLSGSPSRAALFMLLALGRARGLSKEEIQYLLDASWFGSTIPVEIGTDIKLSIRARQVQLAGQLGLLRVEFLNDIDELLEDVSEDIAWAKTSYMVLAMYDVSLFDFPRACRYLQELAKLSPLVEEQMPITGSTVGRTLWMAVTQIDTKEKLHAWLDCLSTFEESQLQDAFNWKAASQGCGVAINGPWKALHVQNPSEDQWRELLSTYASATEQTTYLRLDTLWARTIVARLIILAEYLNDLPSAVRLAEESLKGDSLDESNRFLIQEAIGRQYVYCHQNKKAIAALEAALALETEDYPEIRTRTHLELGSIIGDADAQGAIRQARLSVEIAQKEPTRVGEESLINSLGELSIACWKADDWIASFLALDEAVVRFFAANLESDSSKNLLPRLGHCVSYFSTIASTGNPPDYGEPSAPPFRREFMGWSEVMMEHHDERDFPSHIDAIFAGMSQFGFAVEQNDRAEYWAQRGWDEGLRRGHLMIAGVTGHALFPSLVNMGEYEEALDRMRESTRASWATYLLRHQGQSMDAAHTVEQVLGSKPNQRWEGGERWAIQQGVLPLLLHLATKRISLGTLPSEDLGKILGYLDGLSDAVALPKEWAAAKSFIEQGLRDEVEWDKIKQEAEKWPDDAPHGLRWIGYSAATIQNSIPLDRASVLHARLMCYIERRLTNCGSVQNSIVFPFLDTFWSDVATTRSSELSSSSELIKYIKASRTLRPSDRNRLLLKAALRLSNGRLPKGQNETHKWLQGH